MTDEEKLAEEYFENECLHSYADTEEELKEDVVAAFKSGAEFGYNKANEWHKADIPTSPINKVVLGYIKHYNSKLFCLVGWNGKWWYDAGTYNDEVKLIAWKEIVLPNGGRQGFKARFAKRNYFVL